jgi:tetratricopeptide (TPR) repeat protein
MKFISRFIVLLLIPMGILAQTSAEKFLEEGISKYKKRDYLKSIELFTQAIKADSSLVNGWIYRGIAKDAMDNFPGAISDFNRARNLDTNDIFVYVERAQTFLNMGEYEAAEKDFNKIISINPSGEDAADAFYYLARINSKRKKHDQAINYYTRVMRFRPNDSELYYLRGEGKLALGDNKGAVKDFDMAIGINREYEEAYARRGEAKLNLDDKDGACADFKKAKKNGEKNVVPLLSQYCR